MTALHLVVMICATLVNTQSHTQLRWKRGQNST